MTAKPKLYYFGLQARAEPIRLALAAAGVEFEFEAAQKEKSKQDLDHYKFGQVPRYIDEEVDLCQTNAIVRHVGRKHGLWGKTEAQHSAVEEVMEGVNDLHNTGLTSFFGATSQEDFDAIKEKFWKEHLEPGTETAPESRGAHAAYLSRILAANKTGYFVGDELTIADLFMANTLKLLMDVYKERIADTWPDLVKHHDLVMGQEKVAAYLQSPQRLGPLTIKYA
ncbi:hypothetical protein N2152v2_000143 [Parachlorella kessleri]